MQKIIMLFTVLVMLFLAACSSLAVAVQPTEFSSKGVSDKPTPEVATQTELFPVSVHEQARDLVVAHVAELAGLSLPEGAWTFQDQTPQGLVNSSTWLFTNGPWVVQVSAPVVAPQQTVYEVTVDHMSAVVRWEGTIDSYGNIVETSFVHGTVPESPKTPEELSWIGVLVSNPPDAQFDDYFQTMDQNGTRYGVDGADDVIREQLSAYRDTGVTIQIWGSLQKDVPDAYGIQILVTRIAPY